MPWIPSVFPIAALMAAVNAQEPNPMMLRLQVAGSTRITGGEVAVADAALFIDHTNFDGKSGFVRLQKGLTLVRLVVSSKPVACETAGDFEKKLFLQGNVVPRPKLPDLASPDDFTLELFFLKSFNPRKQDTSVLMQALTRVRVTKLTVMAPWISSVDVPDADIEVIHLHDVLATVQTPSAPGKLFTANPPGFDLDTLVVVLSPGPVALHLDPANEKPPFDAAPLVLRRRGDGWLAEIDISGKELTVKGTVPVRMCQPTMRTINEYEKK